MNDITILPHVMSIAGQRGRLYYYQGNFHHPLFLHGNDVAAVKKAIRMFTKENREMIEADRAKPEYRTVLELFDEQLSEAAA